MTSRGHFLRAIGLLVAAIVLAAAYLVGPAANGASAADVGGVWLTQAGDAKVRVSRCGGGLCGTVVWLRDPIDSATGKAQIDDKNENPALRRRPIIGISLFLGMRAAGPNKWSGRIYNADDGKTYASTVTYQDGGKLDVQGCVGSLCGSETWSRSGMR
jgi:uncharacterized protein (DUF2147 family)